MFVTFAARTHFLPFLFAWRLDLFGLIRADTRNTVLQPTTPLQPHMLLCVSENISENIQFDVGIVPVVFSIVNPCRL